MQTVCSGWVQISNVSCGIYTIMGITTIMTTVKRGFTVTRIPMSQLFEGATGDIRTVLMNGEGLETVGGEPYHCAQDAIQYVCDVSVDRASSIWRKEINNSFKNEGIIREFVFHKKPIAVVTFDSLLLIINNINSGKAGEFKQRFAHLFIHSTPKKQPTIQREKRIREECEETQAVVRVTASLSAQIREDSNITRDNKMVVILAEQKLIAVQDRSMVKRAKIATAEQEQKARLSTAEQEQLQMNADRDLIRRQKLLEFEIAHAERMSKIKLDTEEALVKLAATRPIIVPTTAVLTTGLKTVFQLASQMLPQWKHLSVSEQTSLVNEVGRGLKNLAAPIDKIHESTPMGCFAVNQFTSVYHDQIVEALQTRLAKTARGKQLAQPRGINLYFAPT